MNKQALAVSAAVGKEDYEPGVILNVDGRDVHIRVKQARELAGLLLRSAYEAESLATIIRIAKTLNFNLSDETIECVVKEIGAAMMRNAQPLLDKETAQTTDEPKPFFGGDQG